MTNIMMNIFISLCHSGTEQVEGEEVARNSLEGQIDLIISPSWNLM